MAIPKPVRAGDRRPDMLYGLPLPSPRSGLASVMAIGGTGLLHELARCYARGLGGWESDVRAVAADLRLSVAALDPGGRDR